MRILYTKPELDDLSKVPNINAETIGSILLVVTILFEIIYIVISIIKIYQLMLINKYAQRREYEK